MTSLNRSGKRRNASSKGPTAPTPTAPTSSAPPPSPAPTPPAPTPPTPIPPTPLAPAPTALAPLAPAPTAPGPPVPAPIALAPTATAPTPPRSEIYSVFPRTLSQGEGIWQWLFWMVEGFGAGASFTWGLFSGMATLASRAIDRLQNFQPAGSLHASFIGCFSHSSPFIFYLTPATRKSKVLTRVYSASEGRDVSRLASLLIGTWDSLPSTT